MNGPYGGQGGGGNALLSMLLPLLMGGGGQQAPGSLAGGMGNTAMTGATGTGGGLGAGGGQSPSLMAILGLLNQMGLGQNQFGGWNLQGANPPTAPTKPPLATGGAGSVWPGTPGVLNQQQKYVNLGRGATFAGF